MTKEVRMTLFSLSSITSRQLIMNLLSFHARIIQLFHVLLGPGSHQPVTTACRVHLQASLCAVFGGQSGTVANFLPVFRIFPVNVIPPTLRTHSFVYH